MFYSQKRVLSIPHPVNLGPHRSPEVNKQMENKKEKMNMKRRAEFAALLLAAMAEANHLRQGVL